MNGKKAERQPEPEPHVGIFWLYEGRLVIDSTPLSKAEPYGEALTHARGHIKHWTELQHMGAISPDVEYEEPPRGRVGYDTKTERFWLRADSCILRRKDIVQRIMAALHLPPDKTSTGRDEHYRCAECMNRTFQREED